MTMHTFALTAGRINKFKGQILKHAVPVEALAREGRQVRFPKNQSDTYVARRFLPYGATATDMNTINRFFQNGTGDRGNVVVQAHMVQEGVTPAPDSITPQDVTVVMQQYSCLYGFTDKTYDMYEDDIPGEMITQIGERVTFVNELILYGQLKATTNQFYGGTGTTRATVNGGLTIGLLRKITIALAANHGKMVNRMLAPSNNFGTAPVPAGWKVYCHTDLEPDIRDLPNFTPKERYGSGSAEENELGACERFRFILHPDLPAYQDAGAAVGTTGLYSTTGTSIDVYPVIVLAQDAFSQVAVRGKDSLDPTYLPPGQKSKSDPHGQRGYAGTMWWKAVMIENNGWMAVANVGRKAL